MNEIDQIQARYNNRKKNVEPGLYSPLRASVYMAEQEKERALIRWIHTCGLAPVSGKRVAEVGCGSGRNLLHFLQLGFSPENMTGVELLPDRVKQAQAILPGDIKLLLGDFTGIDWKDSSFDIVLQSTVFTSILDDAFQVKMANCMWSLVKPGGGVLWYDFIYNNPRNPDVRAVSLKRIRDLFPQGKIVVWRLTLAPPISRLVTSFHPSLYTLFNSFPFLRTHVLCWISKEEHE